MKQILNYPICVFVLRLIQAAFLADFRKLALVFEVSDFIEMRFSCLNILCIGRN